MARAAKPKEGATYRYTGDLPLGADQGALLPGTEVTVVAVVPAKEAGAYDDTDDAVVIEWDAPGVVITETREEPYMRPEFVMAPDGNPVVGDDGQALVEVRERKRVIPRLGHGTIRRRMSVGIAGEQGRQTSIGPVDLPGFNDIFEVVRDAG